MKYIKRFTELGLDDLALVGGKNASLGEMISKLKKSGVRVPGGFAVTADGYWYFLESNNLVDELKQTLTEITDYYDTKNLGEVGKKVRSIVRRGTFPEDLKKEIIDQYHILSEEYSTKNLSVAVRSSATAEDLPEASFAGQQETFLNVKGEEELLEAVRNSFASLFTDRALFYRNEHGFDHMSVALSVGVQKMVRSDLASAGVMFTIDTETGFERSIIIESSYGLGEAVVKGVITPDEFRVFKPTLEKGYEPITKKTLGDKAVKLVFGKEKPVIEVDVSQEDQKKFSLSDSEIVELAHYGVAVEKLYSEVHKKIMPMDIEWAKDGVDEKLYIVQARPETVHAPKKKTTTFTRYRLIDQESTELQKNSLAKGLSIGQQIAQGKARVIEDVTGISEFKEGDILITQMTDPDWVPIMKKAAGIITDRGGRTCHAAIVSRELGIPALVGTINATEAVKKGQEITLDCSQGKTGYVYEGFIEFEEQKVNLETIPQLPCELYVNIADPDRAVSASFLPVDGVGLARLEFIIGNVIKIHPMVAIEPEKITDQKVKEKIERLAAPYGTIKRYFIDVLAQGIASIAAAFYPRPIIVRFSDFKTNEYHNLFGGNHFEPEEENPMLGLRGASRYYSPLYEKAFSFECEAMRKAIVDMGLDNIHIMIPFVRTVNEAKKVIEILKQNKLVQGEHGLEYVMMCEVPSNVILMDQFAPYFDGFSIGSNDLTQMVLAVDRDSELLANLFDERDMAVKEFMKLAIERAHANKKYIGVCGQAPSDFPEIAEFLIKNKIDSLSLNIDSVLPFLLQYEK